MTKIANDEEEELDPSDPLNELICDNKLLVEEANELLEGAGFDANEPYTDESKDQDTSDFDSKLDDSQLDRLYDKYAQFAEKKKKPVT